MLCLAIGSMVSQRKFHDPGPLPCRFLENVRIDTSDLGVTVLWLLPAPSTGDFLWMLLHTMCRPIRFLLADSPFLLEYRHAEEAVVEKRPSNRQRRCFVHARCGLTGGGSRGLGPLGPVESQVRVARVCGKTSAAARLISRGRAPWAEPEYATALLLVILVGLTRSAAITLQRISTRRLCRPC